MLAAVTVAACLGCAVAQSSGHDEVVSQILDGMLEEAEEINTGKEVESRVMAMAAPVNLTGVNASDIQAKVWPSAVPAL